jgi:hypothetical protein
MASLIFIATCITVLILLIRMIIKITKHKSTVTTLRTIAIILFCYGLLWVIFYFKSAEIAVPFDTDVCFDDWCATITQAERPKTLGEQDPHGQFIVLQIRMSNHARGIAQKPSEPRVTIIDGQGHSWGFSIVGQQALENVIGKQIAIDERLQLHQSLETKIVFDVPKEAKDLKALIEEGPFITSFLLKDDIRVFILQ